MCWASHAYTWDHMVVSPCPWKLARSAHGTLTKESFFSDHDALLFQLGDLSRDPRCPGLQFQPMGFLELALAHDKPHLPSLTGGDVHFNLLFRVYAEYLQDQLYRLTVHGQSAYDEAHCHRQAAGLRPGQLVPLGTGHFEKRLGDTFVEFKCPEVSVEIREAESCYLTEIPVSHKETPFCRRGISGPSGWGNTLPVSQPLPSARPGAYRLVEAAAPY